MHLDITRWRTKNNNDCEIGLIGKKAIDPRQSRLQRSPHFETITDFRCVVATVQRYQHQPNTCSPTQEDAPAVVEATRVGGEEEVKLLETCPRRIFHLRNPDYGEEKEGCKGLVDRDGVGDEEG
uniref:Uncharacterized protein n=1 Tax=Vespula pensylvanica TaxID=30213 RepID=A0A834JJA5_VESPE|nr:hypothetical protein H0235_017967 [Vespula pensylvanica]